MYTILTTINSSSLGIWGIDDTCTCLKEVPQALLCISTITRTSDGSLLIFVFVSMIISEPYCSRFTQNNRT